MPKPNYEKMWQDLAGYVNGLYMMEQNVSKESRELLGKVQNKIKELENPELFKRLYQKPEPKGPKLLRVMVQKDLSFYNTIYLWKTSSGYCVKLEDWGKTLRSRDYKSYVLAKMYYDEVVKEYVH